MKRLLTVILIASTFFTIPTLVPLTAFADTYGSGSYGGGVYGAQSSSSSNIVSSVGNTIAAFFCTNQAPSSAPNLYEIDVTSTTATVYFSPAAGPDDNYFISYGQGNNNEGNGLQLNTGQSKGAIFYKILQLSPSTVYTFKVRGGNGCKPGPWSNTLTIQTLSSRSRYTKKFYPNSQVTYVQAPAASWWTQAGNYISSILPGVPNTGLDPANQHVLGSSTKNTKPTHTLTTSWWGSITNFFQVFSMHYKL